MLPTSPGISETFIVREMNAVISCGIHVSMFSVRKSPDPDIGQCVSENPIFDSCHFARPGNLIRHLKVNLQCLLKHPVRYISTLWIFLKNYLVVDPVAATAGMYHFFCGIGFSRQIVDQRIQLIHSHFATGSNMALAVSKFTGIPFSFTAHASGDIFVNPLLLNEKTDAAKFVIAVCDYSKKYLDSVTRYKYTKKICRIYNGVMPNEIDKHIEAVNQEKQSTTAGNTLKIISVGRLVNCKGFCTLLEACHILVKRGCIFKCELIGDGPDRDLLEELIKRWHLEHIVSIRGYMPLGHIYKELYDSDIFVLLSEIHLNGYRDGFPTVILEAMLMSLPIVSTWISGIPEMVLHEKTGLLVHERDSEAAADAIEKLLLNHEMRQSYGAAGRKLVLEEFNAEKNTKLLSDILLRQQVPEWQRGA